MIIKIKNLDKEEEEIVKSMLKIAPENTTIEISNWLGEIRFCGLEVDTNTLSVEK